MAVDKEEKSVVIEQYKLSPNDVGSPEVQAALLTKRIEDVASHMESSPKDHHSRRGLVSMVAKRRKLLNYIKRVNPNTYPELIQKLGLRR